jgi:hypothetical protein
MERPILSVPDQVEDEAHNLSAGKYRATGRYPSLGRQGIDSSRNLRRKGAEGLAEQVEFELSRWQIHELQFSATVLDLGFASCMDHFTPISPYLSVGFSEKGTDLFSGFFSGPALLPILNASPNDRFDFVCKSIISS